MPDGYVPPDRDPRRHRAARILAEHREWARTNADANARVGDVATLLAAVVDELVWRDKALADVMQRAVGRALRAERERMDDRLAGLDGAALLRGAALGVARANALAIIGACNHALHRKAAPAGDAELPDLVREAIR